MTVSRDADGWYAVALVAPRWTFWSAPTADEAAAVADEARAAIARAITEAVAAERARCVALVTALRDAAHARTRHDPDSPFADTHAHAHAAATFDRAVIVLTGVRAGGGA